MPSLRSRSQVTWRRRTVTRGVRPATVRAPMIATLRTRATIFCLVDSIGLWQSTASAVDNMTFCRMPGRRPVSHGGARLCFHGLLALVPDLGRLTRHELAAGDLGEMSTTLDQLVESAALDDAAAIEHQDATRVADG